MAKNKIYNEILKKSQSIVKNVKKEYKLGESSKWSYYIAKAITNNKHDVEQITFENAPKPTGNHISRQLNKPTYLDLAKQLIKFTEHHKRLPNYLVWEGYKIRCRLYTLMFAKILIHYNEHKELPKEININSKAFKKPNETINNVFDYYKKKTKTNPKTIDEVLQYVKNNFHYEYYYDDHKTNKEVMDSKSGNCTDLLQWLINIAEALGYEWKCLHVKCRKSGSGHVRGQFKHSKHTDGKWINRDPASVSDGGSITSIWCSDGILIGTNENWFLSNLKR